MAIARSTVLLQRLGSLPAGTIPMVVGLGLNGLSTYVFLLIAGQVLGDARYAPLGALWVLAFLIGPGCFFPVETEVGRAIAERRTKGLGAAPVMVRAAVLTGAIAVVPVTVAAFLAPIAVRELFDDQWLLFAALLLAFLAFAIGYLARGLFAGSRDFRRYGLVLGGEGVFRVTIAGGLAVAGVETAGPYGIAIGVGGLLAVLIALPGSRRWFDAGPTADWAELSRALGSLVLAALLSQTLVNVAPLVVKALAAPAQAAVAGAFTKAIIITRIPLFLFQAVQAMMLPALTAHATNGDIKAFRRTFRRILLMVLAVSLAGVLAAFVFGPAVMRLFGSTETLANVDLALLALGNGLFLLATTVAQALVSAQRQSDLVKGWAGGVVVFAAALVVPGEIVLRVELALLAGSGAALLAMSVLLRRWLRDQLHPAPTAPGGGA